MSRIPKTPDPLDPSGTAFEFARTLKTHWSAVVAYAIRLLNDPDLAEDVAQEAFVRLWCARDQLGSPSLRPFLYRTTRNLAFDELRKVRVRERWGERRRLEVSHERQPTPADHTEASDLASLLETAIQELPDRRREVFTLAYRHGLTYEEIAEIMGLARQTVANHMSSALAQLRRVMAPHLEREAAVARTPTDPRQGARRQPRVEGA